MSTLKDNFHYYLDHQDEFVPMYNGRVLVIHDSEVVGDFENNGQAYAFGMTTCGEGNFLIQRCSPGKKDYTLTLGSQAAFF